MWSVFLFFYNLLCVPLLYVVFAVGSLVNKKIRQGFLGRLRYFRTVDAVVKKIPAGAKVFLFHSSSVGEWEQAVPIINALKTQDPSIFVVVTFFSPSGYNVVKNPIIDAKLFMPYDSWLLTRRFFSILKPKVWIICKYDVWPNMLASAKRARVPVILASAELARDSSRYTFPMKYINRIFYNKIDRILAISEDTRDRFLNIFTRQEHLLVSGDSRYDQIYLKAQRVMAEPPAHVFKRHESVRFIAGSSWPADEKHYLAPLVALMKKYNHLDAIIVPHEIHEGHLREIERVMNQHGISSDRYTNFALGGTTDKRVAIIDTVGLLAKLYRSSHIAYVGGGFSSGVHNVLEPAAFGQPVIFGPRYFNSHEAQELVKNQSACSITSGVDFTTIVETLIVNESTRITKGTTARNFLQDNLGGTENTIAELSKMNII